MYCADVRFHANTDSLRLGHHDLIDTVEELESVMRRATSVVEGLGAHVGQDDLSRGLADLAHTAEGGHEDAVWSMRVLAGRLVLAAQEVDQTDTDLATGVRTGD